MENIDILTSSSIYNNPPSNANQLTIALSIKLHTATRNPGVSINMNQCEGQLKRRTSQRKDQDIEPSRASNEKSWKRYQVTGKLTTR